MRRRERKKIYQSVIDNIDMTKELPFLCCEIDQFIFDNIAYPWPSVDENNFPELFVFRENDRCAWLSIPNHEQDGCLTDATIRYTVICFCLVIHPDDFIPEPDEQ